MHGGGIGPVSISSPRLVSSPESYGGVIHTCRPAPEMPQPRPEDTAGTGQTLGPSHISKIVLHTHA